MFNTTPNCREKIAALIAERLRRETAGPRFETSSSKGVPTCVVDDLLPEQLARRISAEFPATDEMTLKDSIKERKYVSAQMDRHAPLLEEVVYAFQAPEVVQIVSEMTGLEQLEPDKDLYAGGLSAMTLGGYLKPHLDNSHDASQKRYRVLNLLYYVTPQWQESFGGNLEVWDEGPKRNPRTIASMFNRLVMMVTNTSSWHSVSEVRSSVTRQCVSNYYFSPISPERRNYFHATSFRGRPNEKVRDLVMASDNALRTLVLRAAGPGAYRNPHVYQRKPHPAI